MKFYKSKVFIFSLIIVLLITCGITSYYIFISIKRDVNLISFDERVVLSFGKAKTGKISYNFHYKYIQFDMRDEELLNRIKSSEYIIASYITDTYGDYLLAYKGYFFWVCCIDDLSLIRIENLFATIFIRDEPDLYVPFLVGDHGISFYPNEEKPNSITWDFMSFLTHTLVSDFESLSKMYEKLDDFYLREINYEDQFILLNCTQMIYGDAVVNANIALKIVSNEDGIDFEVVYLTNGE
ncbi:MAG: hypothetical protein LBF12_03475 [Christensenellaceae bacterium]|jgi:hypothetical protein|nr:hypothetical protein [Christensenellaceae bacterium]